MKLSPEIENYILSISSEVHFISEERKIVLKKISEYINHSLSKRKEAQLLFVCTQNSRRSHIAQVWMQVAAYKYAVKLQSFSAGGEATAVHPNTLAVLSRAGIKIQKQDESANPIYEVWLTPDASAIKLFSKTIEDTSLPKINFGAVMVCVDDAEACPYVPNAEFRMGLPYPDPKKGDGTQNETEIYDASSREIAREMFYVLSEVVR